MIQQYACHRIFPAALLTLSMPYVGAGLEGVIVKSKDAIYQPGERSAEWVKLKLEHQQVRGTCDCRVRGRLNFG